jgi:hypothetical protein
MGIKYVRQKRGFDAYVLIMQFTPIVYVRVWSDVDS